MSYKNKPQLKLYKYENSAFVLQAIIDDYQECSFENNLYQAGQFSVTINYNIPNASLFQRGLFIQFGDSYEFGEILTITDSIGSEGKGSQIRTITGYDARYILKRRVIKNMNSNGMWVMTAKGELCLRNLIKDQCGSSAETKRQLPIVNTIPESADAIGKEYSVSEQFTNLYEVCKTIATQSEIGWRMDFNGTNLTLVCYEGTDRSQTVQFSPSFDSLANGEFSDSSESFSNAIYIGGKGQNDDRDIYEGEDGTPSGLDRFESWDNQSSMTTESEYEAEALSMLTQYGQTITMSGNGLAKCPYEYEKEYFVGDKITVSFSGKSAVVQILSVTEHWSWGAYDISFSFGKPQNNLADQLQLMLRKIQEASNKTNSTDSVRWYEIPTDTEMPKADVTYNTIGFIGTVGTNATFKLYLDDEKTGAKSYHVWFKQLGGTGKLTLTTGKSEATDLVLGVGTYVAIISVDEAGNIVNVAETPTDTIASGNSQPITSKAVSNILAFSSFGRTLAGADLQTGIIIRVMFTTQQTGSNTTSAMQINYNGTNYNVKATKNGSLVNFVANNINGTYIYCQAYTTLELMFDGTQFIIMGNPVVISSADYTIYTDGSTTYTKRAVDNSFQKRPIIRHTGNRTVDFDLFTDNAIYIEGTTSWGVANSPYSATVGGNYFSGTFNIIDVYKFDNDNIIQICYVDSNISTSSKVYKRSKYNGTWQSWVTI